MFKRLLLMAAALALLLFHPPLLHAQNPEPTGQVFNDLVGAGYDVVEVGNYPDAQGNPDPQLVYVLMEGATTELSDRYVANQVLRGFDTLNKYFPGKQNYIVVLRLDRWLFIFVTTPQAWDDVLAKRVSGADFWANVRAQVRIFDTAERKYYTEKDFVGIQQTNKNQTNKDFTGTGKNPLPPVNSNPDAQPENIALEPSTTYLPANGAAQAYLMATLTDRDFAGLPARGVNFTYEVQGQDERALPAAQTDAFGTARSKIASSRTLGQVLLRATTASLNASTLIVVGDPPGTDTKAQEQAVIEGLTEQGYRDADAGFVQATGPTGQVFRQALAAVRVTSKAFDRQVYSQLFRMLGTLRTVMPDATLLRPILVYAAPDGHEYSILFSLRTDIWDAYIRGDIGVNQLWASISFDGAINENGVRTDDKDFLSKNFSSTQQTRVSRVERSTESALSTETWGEQLNVGSFLVPVGGFADTFRAAELSGNATGFSIYATPDYNTPVFAYTRGNDAALQNLRLESGQYVVSVEGSGAPAKIILQYVEHLGQ